MERKRLILGLLLCVAFVFLHMPLTACAASTWDGSSTAPTQGSGTSGDPYKIGTAEELAWFAGQVNSGDTGICAVLTANIKLNDTDKWTDWATAPPANAWTPIGNSSANQFAGSFDGNGHTVSGIYISSGDCVGLFGRVGTGGNIRNVRVTESYIASSPEASIYSRGAGVCGQNNRGSINGCYNYGTVVGTGNFVGGICAENYGTI
ncbi:MAG: hypothetical protein GX602_04135, partial [Dehalococcoidales bacterium]|nr:hypothetical protein [Dehalococcoidales bacterium]